MHYGECWNCGGLYELRYLISQGNTNGGEILCGDCALLVLNPKSKDRKKLSTTNLS